MPVAVHDLGKLFQQQIKDAYSAESQLIEALPQMTQAATDATLRAAFNAHLKETRTHADRLRKIAEKLQFEPGGHRCKAMAGLLDEGKEVIDDPNAEGPVKDAALICAAQKVEHYEMALYGCLGAYARMLGHDDVDEILRHTADEEKAADNKLTEIAEGWINVAATPDK